MAFNPKVARAVNRQRLAFLKYLEDWNNSHRFGAAAVKLRASWEEHAIPDSEVIRSCVAEMRTAVEQFEYRAPLLGEEEQWTESNRARLGEQGIRDINRERRYKREKFVSVLKRSVGEAIYWAIGAGAFQKPEDGNIPYLYDLAKAFDEERIDDAYSRLFHITYSKWVRLLRLGYGGTKGYPGSEFDVVLGNYAGEMRKLVETTKKIAELFEEEVEFWENFAGQQAKPALADDSSGENSPQETVSEWPESMKCEERMAALLVRHRADAEGWSKRDFAQLCGFTPSTVQKTPTWRALVARRTGARNARHGSPEG